MQNHRILQNTVLIALAFMLMHCANTWAPRDWLAEPDKVPMDAYGGWVSIDTGDVRLKGELIALSPDTLYYADSLFHAVAVSTVQSARVVVYDVGGLMGAEVLLGMVSTVSNGWFLVLTFPMWLIGGPIVGSIRSYDPVVDYPDSPLKDLAMFARFPQGLPPGLERGALRMKTRPK